MRVAGRSEHDLEALEGVDEMAALVVYAWQPTLTLPGSLNRIAVYRARVTANEFRPPPRAELVPAEGSQRRAQSPRHRGVQTERPRLRRPGRPKGGRCHRRGLGP